MTPQMAKETIRGYARWANNREKAYAAALKNPDSVRTPLETLRQEAAESSNKLNEVMAKGVRLGFLTRQEAYEAAQEEMK